MAIFLTFSFGVLAVLGVVALVFALFFWESIKQFYQSVWAKTVIAIARVSAVVVALAARTPEFIKFLENLGLAKPNEEWWEPAVACALAWFTWELTQAVGDVRMAKAVVAVKKLTRTMICRLALINALRRLVLDKVERIAECFGGNEKQPTIKMVKDALQPERQIFFLLEQFSFVLWRLHEEPQSEESETQTFRVGLYVEQDGYMTPLFGCDFRDKNYRPFKSYRQHKENFAISNTRQPCNVVRCVQSGELVIVPDCQKAAEENEFWFFSSNQRSYLKSMFAYPILNFRTHEGKVVAAAIVVDTHVPRFFKEEDRPTIQLITEEFATRLKLEMQILCLLKLGIKGGT